MDEGGNAYCKNKNERYIKRIKIAEELESKRTTIKIKRDRKI